MTQTQKSHCHLKKKKNPYQLHRSTTVSVRGMKKRKGERQETIVGTGDHTIMDFCLCFKSGLKQFKNFYQRAAIRKFKQDDFDCNVNKRIGKEQDWKQDTYWKASAGVPIRGNSDQDQSKGRRDGRKQRGSFGIQLFHSFYF